MNPLLAAGGILVLAFLLAGGSALDITAAATSDAGCVRLEHEWNGGAARYKAETLADGAEPTDTDARCASGMSATFRMPEAGCVDVSMTRVTHSDLNGAPPHPTEFRTYVLPASAAKKHGALGRDAWPSPPVLQNGANAFVERDTICGEPGSQHRLVIRACRYGPLPPQYPAPTACDGLWVYDVNSDDLGRTNPLFEARHG